jgi:hypothetical protein
VVVFRSSVLVCLSGKPDPDRLLVAPMITGIAFNFAFQNQSMKLCAKHFSASFFKLRIFIRRHGTDNDHQHRSLS